mmetsp:Transcript_13957/g.33329  ORF Transcript_13957/g.33329 Transcript_13957/m.33329 type:complete len:211 (-) Transcript_13957:410-1042(-)
MAAQIVIGVKRSSSASAATDSISTTIGTHSSTSVAAHLRPSVGPSSLSRRCRTSRIRRTSGRGRGRHGHVDGGPSYTAGEGPLQGGGTERPAVQVGVGRAQHPPQEGPAAHVRVGRGRGGRMHVVMRRLRHRRPPARVGRSVADHNLLGGSSGGRGGRSAVAIAAPARHAGAAGATEGTAGLARGPCGQIVQSARRAGPAPIIGTHGSWS